jgi:site-specific DNA-methyltransferase (adenine-specific)
VLNQILLGDCLDVLRTLPDASVDCVITDPPYGLGTKDPTLEEILAYLQGAELDTGGDFMGRKWTIPSVSVWKECFRVLKPGGHLLSFGGTRTWDLISLGIRAAGFDNRDTIATQFGTPCLEWLYGQGFPKSLNIAKALEEAGADPELVAKWKGWGTALKPAWEPILVFRKPIEGAVTAQVFLTGTGAININANRVGITKADAEAMERCNTPGSGRMYASESPIGTFVRSSSSGALDTTQGRWPANVLLVHSEGCKIVGTKRVPAPVINRFDDGMKPFGDGAGHPYTSEQTGDADGMEDVTIYECEDGCPVKVLDEQGGERRSSHGGGNQSGVQGGVGIGFSGLDPSGYRAPQYADTGGASRFFGQFQPEAPFFYTAKVSKSERNRGVTAKSFRKGFVTVREDLSENDVTDLLEKWPGGFANPFAFGYGGERIQFEKKRVPEPLWEFFEDVLPDTNMHPTVKPRALMTWLVKLVAPVGATVLDPYCGSGTTCVAALDCDCNYIGIERDPGAHETATKRIEGLRAEIQARADERLAAEAFELMSKLDSE